jgi:hypothetical protein
MLDVGKMADVDSGGVSRIMNGSAFKSVVEGIDQEAIRGFDKEEVITMRGYRRAGTGGRFYSNRISSMVDGDSVGRVREVNVGQGQVTMIPHTWYLSDLENVDTGPFYTKAHTAFENENSAFDSGYYRMNRRDPENLRGYLVAHYDRGEDRYCSFVQEAMSHVVYHKVVRRNLFLGTYSQRITTQYQLQPLDQAQGDVVGPTGSTMRAGAILMNGRMEVRSSHPGFHLHVNTPAGPAPAGAPGNDSRVVIIPNDEVMSKQVATGGVNDVSGYFVSRAKTAEALAQDILALFSGTRTEFGIYGEDPVLILAAMTSRDYGLIMNEWGLTPDRSGNLRNLAHYLRYSRGYQGVSGYYNAPKTDLLRCRDFMAYSNVEVGGGQGLNARWWRPSEIADGIGMQIPYATWQSRLCQIYCITSLRNDDLVSIPGWEDMRSAALFRGVNLGGLVDYASQRTIGSWRNLAYFTGTNVLELVFKVSLTLSVNWAYVGGHDTLLGFRFDWTAGDLVEHVRNADTQVICDNRVAARALAVTVGTWAIESRGCWASAQSLDVVFPVITEIPEWKRSDVVRFASQTVYSYRSSGNQVSRMISCVDLQATPLNYSFTSALGEVTVRLRLTNNTNPCVYVDWSSSLDKEIMGRISGAGLIGVETRQAEVSVRYDSAQALGSYNVFSAFSGFSGGL